MRNSLSDWNFRVFRTWSIFHLFLQRCAPMCPRSPSCITQIQLRMIDSSFDLPFLNLPESQFLNTTAYNQRRSLRHLSDLKYVPAIASNGDQRRAGHDAHFSLLSWRTVVQGYADMAAMDLASRISGDSSSNSSGRCHRSRYPSYAALAIPNTISNKPLPLAWLQIPGEGGLNLP